MNTIRTHALTKVLTLITGIVFLNMSFFLAEVCVLKYNKTELVEIAKLILNTGFEEERDGASSDNLGKEVVLDLMQAHFQHTSSYSRSVGTNRTLIDHYRHANHSLTFFLPPDIS